MRFYDRYRGRDIDDCGNCIYLESDDMHEYCTYFAESLEDCDCECTFKKTWE